MEGASPDRLVGVGAMDSVEGLLRSLKLTETEKKSVRIGGGGGESGSSEGSPKAFGKLLSEKYARAETIEQAVGWIRCPMKGIECKELGDNCFLITFLQASGKRRALDDGPWMISKELLVISDFDGSKSLDEVDFSSIPIWV